MSDYKDKRQRDLTEGNVSRQLLSFSIPFLISNVLQALYNVIDMLIVGNVVGERGISAINVSGQVMFVISALVTGLSIGATVLVAQFKGANEMGKARDTIGTMFTVFFIISMVMSVISLILSPWLLRVVNVPEEAYSEAVDYLRICGLGIIFIFGYNAVSSVLRGLGDSKRPLYFIAFSTILNILLDLLFVSYFDMGTAGAAFATVISQACAFIISIIYLRSTNFIFDFKLKSFKIHKNYLKLLFKIGLPSSVQMTITSVSFLFMTSLINEYGLSASAAAGIGSRIDSFATLPSLALSAAVSSMVGQNIGAEKYDRVKKTVLVGIAYSFSMALTILILVNVFPKPLIMAFIENPDTVSSIATMEAGERYLHLASWAYLPLSIMFVFNGLANGSGNTLFSLINTMCTVLVVRVPFAIMLSRLFGLDGVYMTIALAPFGGMTAGAIFFLSKRWQRTKIVHKTA